MSVGLIMAGGLGKRLWPESSVTHPKHLLSLVGRESFLQAAYRRASHLFGRENTFLVIREELKEAVVSQLPELPADSIIAEPQGKDTAPCIGFASVWIRKRKGDDSMVVLPADHIIRDEERFAEIISAAAKQAKKGLLVTIGIKPTRAETGYGYLEIGNKLGDLDGIPLFEVKRFTEKPSHKKAKEFFEQGNFLWNAGIFAWTPTAILKQMELHLPELYQGLIRIEEALGTKDEPRVIREVYPTLPKISIDYGIMEKVSSVVAVPGGFDCAPKECPKSNLYVIAMEAWTAPDYFYTEGVSAITSKIPVKSAFFAEVKSCNYLPNVLVDMEAEQNKVEFAIMVDPEGYLAEAATENVAIVNEEKIFMYPKFHHILKGTSLLRGAQLTKDLIKAGDLKGISQANISREKAYKSSEMLLFGTGPNVLPIVKYDGKPIGTGKPGSVFRRLRELFQKDVKENKKVLTPCHRYCHLL